MDMISKLEGLVKGQTFINDDFMLTNDFARELYHESAERCLSSTTTVILCLR